MKMIKAVTGVNYINGTSVSANDGKQNYQGDNSKLHLGQQASNSQYINHSVGDRILLADTHLGQNDRDLPVGFVKDRAPNLPSGYDNHGAATFGSGKQNTVTTFAKDLSGPSGSLTWNEPLRQTKKRYNDLTP
jgi:hypothetical protein